MILYNLGVVAGPPVIGLGMDLATHGFAYSVAALLALYAGVVLWRLRA